MSGHPKRGVDLALHVPYSLATNVGDKILFGKHSGTEVKLHGEESLIIWRHRMDRIREIERGGRLGTAAITPEVLTPPGAKETAHSPCRWPTMAITDLAMRDVDATLAADPLFHLCPDGHEGQVDMRYWDFPPLDLSCRHCSEGGGLCVVAPETVGCCQRGAHWTDAPVVEG